MESLYTFYKEQITIHKEKETKLKKQLLVSSMLRLVVFFSTGFGIYVVFGNTKLVLAIVLVSIIIFLFLVSRHTDLQYKRDKVRAIIKGNQVEVSVLNRDFHNLPNGQEFANPMHYYSQDIDLFGKGSFYQYSNRTALEQGSETLASIFTANTITGIAEKQEAVKELAKMPEWRQEFSAVATLVKTDMSSEKITKWLQEYTPFVPKIMKQLPVVFSVVSALLLGAYFLGFGSGILVAVWFFIGMGVTGGYVKKINKLSYSTSKVQSVFHQYQKLLTIIEDTNFKADLLVAKKELITDKDKKASAVLKRFARILSALDQRNNMIIGIFANGFLLWDLKQSYKIEHWIQEHGLAVEGWFSTIAFYDAYNSLGNFAFNHPSYTYPVLSKDDIVLKATNASHPLLDPKKGVTNDITINKEQFFIVTGANMAGKSTFLRTISLQIVMANMGLPVCGTEVIYNPIKLITSMRTVDSLSDDESYFFSELKRLKFIVDQIQLDNYFIVLDEILKGTNSTDKAIGSKKFVEKLVASKSTGIIATHDLSLCEAAEVITQIQNHYFDAEIIDDELYFDYKFKKGVCKNMNASFLLKKMKIVD